MYISIDNILKYPAMFIKIGKKLPTNINIACLEKKPEFAFEEAVRRMLPKGVLGRQMLKKLNVYRGAEHNHAAQKPEVLELRY